MRTNSIGWQTRIRPLLFNLVAGAVDVATTSLTRSGLVHLRLAVQSNFAAGATATLLVEGNLRGSWVTIKSIALTEESEAFTVYEFMEAGIYSDLRFSLNKTGNSVINITEMSQCCGAEPVTVTDQTLCSTSSDEPLFAGVPS